MLQFQKNKLIFEQLLKISKKPALVLANSMLVTKAKNKFFFLDWVLYIYYSIQFKKNKIQALTDFDNKVNTIILGYILKLEFQVRYTNIKA